MEGTQVTFHPDGTIQSMLNYKDGLLQGHCQWWHANGALAKEATFNAGKPCFMTRMWDMDRRIIHADIYHEDNGGYARISYHEDGSFNKEKNYRIVDGLPRPIGLQRAWWGTGKLRYIRHHGADGMLHGPSAQFYATGLKKAEYNWIGGVLHGEFATYYTCGKKYMEGFFQNGQLHGKYVEWAADGSLLRHASYWNGAEVAVYYDAYTASSGESSLMNSPLAMEIC